MLGTQGNEAHALLHALGARAAGGASDPERQNVSANMGPAVREAGFDAGSGHALLPPPRLGELTCGV